MIEFQFTPRGEVVLIHEGTPEEPLLFSFKDKPEEFYTFKRQDPTDKGCGDCALSGRHKCGDAPACGTDTAVYNFLAPTPLQECKSTKFSKRFYEADPPLSLEYNGLNVEKICL